MNVAPYVPGISGGNPKNHPQENDFLAMSPPGRPVLTGMTLLENFSLGKMISVPDSLGKCFRQTPKEFPFHTPVWINQSAAWYACEASLGKERYVRLNEWKTRRNVC